MTLRLLIAVLFLACIPAIAGSVLDASPFASCNEPAVAGATSRLLDPDRVNLWPFFYYNRPTASLLWPMVDWREDGHAFRPLYSFYNNYREWNFVWPLVQLDFDKREYFAVNTWWDSGSVASVPFFFYEKDDYWCSPFIAGKGTDWLSIMPPLSGFSWGNERTQWVFPLYWYNRAHDERTFVSLLGGWGTDRDRTFVNVLGPVFNRAWNAFDGYSRTDVLWPLATRRITSNTFHLSALPLFWYDRSANATATYSLVSHGQEDGSTFVNVLGPVFHHQTWNSRHRSYLHAAWPLFALERADDDVNLHSPRTGGRASTRAVLNHAHSYFNLYSFPLAGYERNGSRRTYKVLWPLFELVRGSNLFEFCSFPLARYKRHGNDLSTWALWPMIQYERGDNGSRRSLWILPLFGQESSTMPVAPEFHYPTNNPHRPSVWRDIHAVLPPQTQHWSWIVPSWYRTTTLGVEEDFSVPIPPELKADAKTMVDYWKAGEHVDIWRSYATRRYSIPTRTVEDGLWPLWSRENHSGRSGSFSIGIRLYQREWEKGDPASSSWRILWRVARSNRTGEDVSFESFPFITFDRRRNQSFSQFAVCWRLYRYRCEGRRRALDLFFIPIRWGAD